MSDAPETIWVNINDSEDGCCPVEDEHFGDGRFYDPDTATEYRRANLPPTLSAAMGLPEVVALVEALRDMRRQFSPYPSQDTERWREEHEACEHADAALAAIKEPKP